MNRLKKRYLQINYKGQILDLEVLRYNTGNRIAIQAYTKTKEPFDVLTVNIPAYDADFDDTYIFLNTNHVPDIDKVLEKEGMIENTGYRLQSGYCTYPVVRLVKMIDDNVAFDFISDKMLQLDERIIFAKRLIYNDINLISQRY